MRDAFASEVFILERCLHMKGVHMTGMRDCIREVP